MSIRREAGAEHLAVALDVAGLDAARELATAVGGRASVFKVGLELFVAAGPAACEAARAGGAELFLDLKVHDIPRTAAAALRSAGALHASYVTLHALGGPAMIAAAREAAESLGGERPKLLAVTLLTSHDADELARLGLSGSPDEEVLRLARLAVEAGADGLVCSAREVGRLRRELGPAVRFVTPGIRPAGESAGDQRRVATPADAIRDGADLLVVGRPIVKAPDPARAAASILEEIRAAGAGS